ncbi:MAG: M20 family metallo-hydrolase [Candidatus Odinarchaeota archaeon]|nr:M20 family metallo-hydrolase [Candidatus Odinarchaeota archaeon]
MINNWVISILKELVSRNSVNPAYGGPGEKEKADFLQSFLENMGLKVKRYEVTDEKGFVRPSLITEIGKGDTIWIIAHIDIVPPGKGWESDPFKLKVEGDKVYGRGVNDNGIGIVSALYVLKQIIEHEHPLNYKLKVGFVADEEAGSKYGLKYLIEQNVFKKGDRALVPDGGNKNGDMIEIAEKGILWVKMVTKGKQVHGSMPAKGDNAFLKSMRFATKLYDVLHKKYDKSDSLFDPPNSTFEPTMKEKNVDSINIVPGEDVHYWDCRVLPDYKLDDVLKTMQTVADEFNTKVEIVMREDASRVDASDWIVQKTVAAVKKVIGVEPKLMGIGGGTFAGILRKMGIPSVVWHIGSETEHTPNEWELISNYVKNARVFLSILSS